MTRPALLALIIIATSSCSDGGSSPEGTIPIPIVKSATISAADGGSIESADGSLSLSFPTGSVTADTEISVTQLDTTALDTIFEEIPIDIAFDFAPDGTRFEQPAILNLSLGQASQGADFGLPLVILGSGDELELLNVTTTSLNNTTGNLTLSAEIPHFSTIVVSFDPNNNFVLASANIVDYPEEVFGWEEFEYKLELRNQAAIQDSLTRVIVDNSGLVETRGGDVDTGSTDFQVHSLFSICKADTDTTADVKHRIDFSLSRSNTPSIDILLKNLATRQGRESATITGEITDRLRCLAPRDLDGDGLNGKYETLVGTNPNDDDSDSDGILDGDEDADNDGFSNFEEQQNGTDPNVVNECVTDCGSGDVDVATDDLGNDSNVGTGDITAGSDTVNETPDEASDNDGDGIIDTEDTDDDGDGVLDVDDAFPFDAAESIDTDEDGIGNNADTDDDGDNVPDSEDAFPLDATETVDTDKDGIGNTADDDDDGDGATDRVDAFPLNPSETKDTDGDGIGDNADTDDDGDGVLDTSDAFPLDASKQNTEDELSALEYQAPVRTALAIAQLGDVAATESGDITQEVIEAKSLSLGDDGTVLLVALLADDRTALIRSVDADVRELEIIAITSSTSGGLISTVFDSARLARSIPRAGLVTFLIGAAAQIDSLSGPGLWSWQEGKGLQPVLLTGSACATGGTVTMASRLLDLNAEGFGLLLVDCSAGRSYFARTSADGIQVFRNQAGDTVDGFGEADTVATINSVRPIAVGSDGSVIAYQLITCTGTGNNCFADRSGRLVTMSASGSFHTLLSLGEQILPGNPRAFSGLGISTGQFGLDRFDRLTSIINTYPDKDTYFTGAREAILRISSAKREFLHEFQYDEDGNPAPGLPGRSINWRAPSFLNVADNGDILIAFPLEGDNFPIGLFTYRDGHIDPLIAERDAAIGDPTKTLLDISNVSISPSGRAAFRVVETDGGFTAYAEDRCEDRLFVHINAKLFQKASSRLHRFSSVELPKDPFNAEGQLLATIRRKDSTVVLFDLPAGRCAFDLSINDTRDQSDANIGDGKCDTGQDVNGKPACTLRAAIEEVNANATGGTVTFDFLPRGTDILIQPTRPLPMIERQMSLAPGEVTTDNIVLSGALAGDAAGLKVMRGNLSLKNFTVRDFTQNGVDAEQSGDVVNLERMKLINNGGFGIHAFGPLSIEGTDQAQALISGNSRGGVYAEGGLTSQSVDIKANTGPGIIAGKGARLISVRVDNNGAEGFVSKLAIDQSTASCNEVQLTVSVPFSAEATVQNSTFNGNGGIGIYIDPGSIRLDPGTVINDNAGSGIVAECGLLTIGYSDRSGDAIATINGNAKGANCSTVDEESDYQLVTTSCVGGGIEIRESFSSSISNFLDEVSIQNNGGFGVLTTAKLKLQTATITNNLGPGIWAAVEADTSFSGQQTVVDLVGNNINISGNLAEGVRVDNGRLVLGGFVSIMDNRSSGVIVSEGDVLMNSNSLEKNVVDNGGALTGCWNWSYDPIAETASRILGACQQDGVVVENGEIKADNLTITGHPGTGLKVSGDPDDINAGIGTAGDASLLSGQICGNGTDFEVLGSLTLDTVNRTCP